MGANHQLTCQAAVCDSRAHMLGTAVLQHMSTVVPLLSWRASHVKSFKQLLTFSLQAKGSSSASLHAWRGLMEVQPLSRLDTFRVSHAPWLTVTGAACQWCGIPRGRGAACPAGRAQQFTSQFHFLLRWCVDGLYHIFWLVVWNSFYFPYVGNNHPN